MQMEYAGSVFVPQLVFSSAQDGRATLDPVRFTPLCFEAFANTDYSRHFGTYMSVGYRQVGYLKQVDDSTRMKFRTWNISIGIGAKAGNMQRGLFFGGYRFEWPFNYRERRFVGDELTGAKSGWVSRRTPTFSHVVEFGYQFRFGLAVRFDYYLNSFHRSSFSENVNAQQLRPYAGWNDHLIAVSLIIAPFKDAYGARRSPDPEREILL
jgi:hypothetical protein